MKYYFFIGWSWKAFVKYMRKNQGHTITRSEPNGYTCHRENVICIWVGDKTQYPTLAHECLHAANFTLDRIGWQADLNNDEPQTYLLSDIMLHALGRSK